MTAKEKQKELIKIYLKPVLKSFGYLTSGQTWWKDKGDFYTLINLQNYSWNNKETVDFCFNIGIALKATMSDIDKKNPTVHDLTVDLREGFYLPINRQEYIFRNKSGYTLTEHIELNDFITEIKSDFENHILPFLNNLNSLNDCIKNFGDVSFWGDNLRRIVEENNLLRRL